jgi:hypothetical protein
MLNVGRIPIMNESRGSRGFVPALALILPLLICGSAVAIPSTVSEVTMDLCLTVNPTDHWQLRDSFQIKATFSGQIEVAAEQVVGLNLTGIDPAYSANPVELVLGPGGTSVETVDGFELYVDVREQGRTGIEVGAFPQYYPIAWRLVTLDPVVVERTDSQEPFSLVAGGSNPILLYKWVESGDHFVAGTLEVTTTPTSTEQPVPEPGTALLMVFGLAAVVCGHRFHQRPGQ